MFLIKIIYFITFIILSIIDINRNLEIQLDNQISEFENNINFSNLTTDIKAIALYLPQFHEIKENNEWWGKGFTEWSNVKKSIPLFKGHHQPRIPGDKKNYLGYYELTEVNVIKKQIDLAKSHGIYGFGFYYYWFSGKTLLEKPLIIYLNNKDLKFPFLLIWANENWTKKWDGKDKDILIKQEYFDDDPEKFIKDIKKYLMDERYIRIKNKPILGLYEPSKVPKLNETIRIWRKKAKEYQIGELFILFTLNENTTNTIKYSKLFDAAYDFPPRFSFGNYIVKFKNTFIYSVLIYYNLVFQINNTITKNFSVFRGNMLEWDNCPRTFPCYIFDYYSPEQFYIINKMIIDWTKKHYNNELSFIFINAWNEWGEGSYLEPDEKYGYASINSLSKALFNLPYISTCDLTNLKEKTKIAIYVDLYNEDFLSLIINKTNNIPFKFDLYISINFEHKKEKICSYIKNNSFTSKYQIKILTNKRRNILPLLLNLKKQIKKYKYFCHLHNKKPLYLKFADEWRNYLYENLLGNNKIISEILTEFENNEKLGFIFPEDYYKILNIVGKKKNDSSIVLMNFILKKISYKYRISINYFDFPEGNMFWARVRAVHQIFKIDRIKSYSINKSLMEEIECIWLFIVKLNGYYYKKIYKHI